MNKSVKKIAFGIATVMTIGIMLTGCSNGTNTTKNISDTKKQYQNKVTKITKIGIVLSIGGKGDKSFNDLAIEGLEKAKKDLGIIYKDIQPKNTSEYEKSLEFLAQEGYDLVIAGDFMQKDALGKVALRYPDVKFAIIDSEYGKNTPPNVIGLIFKENEGSYLAGALAASITKTKVVGFVGGMDVPMIHSFEGGFSAGVKAVNPNAIVLVSYIGTDSSAFNNQDKAKQLALNMVSRKADVIFHAARSSGEGVFEACKIQDIKAIGVDSNQNWMKPGIVIASMLKRVDVAVGNTVKTVVDGSFKGGVTQIYGLSEDGVGLTNLNELTIEETTGLSADDQKKIKDLKDTIPNEVKQNILDIKKKIISGETKVPDWLNEGKPSK